MRSIYTPDRWVVIRITYPENTPFVREEDRSFECVLAGWTGGYLDSDRWRRSTRIIRREDDGEYLVFTGESGSSYRCHKQQYGFTILTGAVLEQMHTSADKDGATIKVYTQEEL